MSNQKNEIPEGKTRLKVRTGIGHLIIELGSEKIKVNTKEELMDIIWALFSIGFYLWHDEGGVMKYFHDEDIT